MVHPRIRIKYCKYGHDMDIGGRDPKNRCLECGRIRLKKFRQSNLEHIRKQGRSHKRFHRYGMTQSLYDSMLSVQQNKCAICGGISSGRSLAIDHCHKTGKIRGLLCEKCNWMIGFAKDNPDILRSAIEYLK